MSAKDNSAVLVYRGRHARLTRYFSFSLEYLKVIGLKNDRRGLRVPVDVLSDKEGEYKYDLMSYSFILLHFLSQYLDLHI